MSSKVKLWLNIIAIVLVFVIITILIGSLFRNYEMFLKVPGTRPLAQDLSMEIDGKVNGTDFFNISFKNGIKTQNKENLEKEDMLFTADRTEITFEMEFKNLSKSELYLEISGIYRDIAKFSEPRFETIAYINDKAVALIVDEEDKGVVYFSIQSPTSEDLTPSLDDDSLVKFKIVYTQKAFNRNINNEKQDLLITISDNQFDH